MEKQTMGMMISSLRKENGMTQLELALAMGVSTVVLSVLKQIDIYSGFTMAGIGLTCVAISLFDKK